MGVPGFFLWLYKHYSKYNNFILNKSSENIDYFLLDMNCMIHPVCFDTLKELQPTETVDINRLENKMINNVIIYLEKLIDMAKPIKGVYLAVDGVAPVAKMKQQRLRRYKSINDKKLFDNIRKKHNKVIPYFWNNSAITPGTNFMQKLTEKLKNWCKEYHEKTKLEILFSPSNVPAEGEHKLLQYIKNNTQYSYIIYGLDADLIFLMLATGLDNIYLMREAQHMEKKSSDSAFNYVSIEIMRECIFDSVQKIMNKMEVPIPLIKKNIINDFIFICYLMGNDFLPHLPALDIYNNAIDKLLVCYVENVVLNGYIIIINDSNNNININNDNYYSFIIKLASDEERLIMEHYNSKKRRAYCQSTDPFDIEMNKIENLQFKINDPINLGQGPMSDWRPRFYNNYYHNNNPTDINLDSDLDEFTDKMVYHYNVGLKWVAMYYFDKCPSWDYYYPYDHAPFLTDMARSKFDFNNVVFKESSPLKPFEQLLIVLPKESAYLLPTELQKIMTNPNSSASHLYPNEFQLDMIGKRKYWMCNPILPNLEINLIKKMFEKYSKLLKEEDIKKNSDGKLITL
uniref:Xrn1 N-terminal domain-containing protein n=1 Tax=viral metagenome TaxID=1070528 RepID=A0A6C0HVL6_9ZZZZ